MLKMSLFVVAFLSLARWSLLGFVLGIIVGSLAMWVVGPVRVRVVSGYAVGVNESQSAIGLAPQPDAAGEGYSVADTFWRDAAGAWHTNAPITCLDASSAVPVRMGIVDVPATREAPGGRIAVWLECPAQQR